MARYKRALLYKHVVTKESTYLLNDQAQLVICRDAIFVCVAEIWRKSDKTQEPLYRCVSFSGQTSGVWTVAGQLK